MNMVKLVEFPKKIPEKIEEIEYIKVEISPVFEDMKQFEVYVQTNFNSYYHRISEPRDILVSYFDWIFDRAKAEIKNHLSNRKSGEA